MWPFTQKEDRKSHWEGVYQRSSPEKVGWYQEHPDESLRLIKEAPIPPHGSIVDVGGGASRLSMALLDAGYSKITVLDISHAALAKAQERMGVEKNKIDWVTADILSHPTIGPFDLWHDRAVFHFLTDEREQELYLAALAAALAPKGSVVIATFALDGPQKCSGLPVARYSAETLQTRFGAEYRLLTTTTERHHTPGGTIQPFVYCLLERK